MKVPIWRVVVSGLIGLALVLSGCSGSGTPVSGSAGGLNEAKDSQSFSVTGDVTVTISSYSGDIQVKAGSSDKVQVDVVRHGGGTTDAEAKADLGNIQTSLNQTVGNVKLMATHKGAVPTGSTASFVVTMPSGSILVALVDNGSMTIDGITASVTATGSNGNVTVTNAGKGGINAKTVNGNVTLSGSNVSVLKASTQNGDASFSGSLTQSNNANRLDVGNGDARLTVPGDAQFGLDALTANGTLTSDFTFQGDTSPAAIKGTLGASPTFNVTVRVKNGSIAVKKS